MKIINQKALNSYAMFLVREEKSRATVEKYIRDIDAFAKWMNGDAITKDKVMNYKEFLIGKYSSGSVNSILSSINSFLRFAQMRDCCVKTLKIQKRVYASEQKELSKAEYDRLAFAAKAKNERLYYIMQTICSTGIRISELKYITVEAIRERYVEIKAKGKIREILLPAKLCKLLKAFASCRNIKNGPLFITKNGNPVDRSNIWHEMKKLSEKAGVYSKKIFPHNLRHLFARLFYKMEKDIVRLADILGHSNLNTTRIYTMETVEKHRRSIDRLGCLVYK